MIAICLSYLFDWVQEIKFEPNVMCEHIDKKLTFKASQVHIIPNLVLITRNFVMIIGHFSYTKNVHLDLLL